MLKCVPFEPKEQGRSHVNQGRHCQGEIKLYFWTNNSLKGHREKNSFNVEAFVAFNVILCSSKNARKCVAGWRILDILVWSFYTLQS